MRDYGKVHIQFWSSQTIRSMTEDGRMLALYLLTSPHTTLAGVFRLPDGYASEDLGWASERVSEGFKELFRKGFANRCETTKWAWICKHLDWNPPENPNQRKAAAKMAASIPDECAWKPDFMRVYGEKLGMEPWTPPEPLINPSETLSKPVTGTVTGAVTGTGAEPPPGQPAKNPPAIRPEEPKAPKAEKPDTEFQAACRETWEHYRDAYAQRYEVKPVRNAKVNAHVKQLVQRLGRQEAPQVAAFYLTHNDAFYIRKAHDIGLLVSDAEKLRTECLTQRKVTGLRARQEERAGTTGDIVGEILRERAQA